MKKLIAALLVLGSLGAFAKETLTNTKLEELDKSFDISNLRVYTNKKIRTYWENTQQISTGLSTGGLKTKFDKKLLKVVVGKRVKGLITSVSEDYRTIYVAFDSECFKKECSYKYETDYSYSDYYLRELPTLSNYSMTKIKIGGKKLGSYLSSYNTYGRLNFDKKELYNTTKKVKRAQGH